MESTTEVEEQMEGGNHTISVPPSLLWVDFKQPLPRGSSSHHTGCPRFQLLPGDPLSWFPVMPPPDPSSPRGVKTLLVSLIPVWFLGSPLSSVTKSLCSTLYKIPRVVSVFSLFIHSVMSNSLQPRGPQHTRLPCLSPTPGACSNSCP